MKNPEKIKIQIKDVPYLYIDFDIIEGDIKEVSKKILDIKNKLKTAYDARNQNIGTSYREDMVPQFTPFKDYQYIHLKTGYGHDYDVRDISLEVWRDETDEEYNKRLESNKKKSNSAKLAAITKKITQEKREKSLLLTLKKKYESKN
jgi:hypothetical protein